MLYITQVKDDIEFLGRIYDASEKVMSFLDVTKLMQIRQEKPANLPIIPVFPKNFKDLTTEEQAEIIKKRAEATDVTNELIQEQMIKNVRKMLSEVCKKHPQEFVDTVRTLIVLEDGEDYPHGMELLSTAVSMFTSVEMIDFFTQLTTLGQIFSEK